MQDNLLSQAFLSGFMQQCEKKCCFLKKEAVVQGKKTWWDTAKSVIDWTNPIGIVGKAFGQPSVLADLPGQFLGAVGRRISQGGMPALRKEVGKLEKRYMPYVAGMAAAPFVSQLMLGPGGMFGPKAGMSQAQVGQMMGNMGRTQRSPMANRLFDYQKLNF
jgi:hypothetical protein